MGRPRDRTFTTIIQLEMNTKQFTYASARVRALETKLLNLPEVERILGASSAKDAYKILNDLDYSTHIGDINNISDFQVVVDAGLEDTKTLIAQICPDSKILDLLFISFDFHNIKTILKGSLNGNDRDSIESQLLSFGMIPKETILSFMLDEDKPLLSIPTEYIQIILAGIERAKKSYKAQNNDPRLIDLILDQTQMELLAQIAESTRNKFISDFVKAFIDLSNIKAFIRVKMLKQEAYFEEMNENILFAEGGVLKPSHFLSKMDADTATLINMFRGTNYSSVVSHGIEAFEKHKSFVYLEKYANDYLLGLAKKSKFIPFGPEALIAYFFAKQNNAQIIRMIMVGKLNHIEQDLLRERLNTLYV